MNFPSHSTMTEKVWKNFNVIFVIRFEKLLSNSVDPVKNLLNGSSASFFISLQIFEKFDHCYQKLSNDKKLWKSIFLHIFKNETYNFILNVIDKFSDCSMPLKDLKNWEWKSLKRKIFCLYFCQIWVNLIIKQEGLLDWRNLLEFH